MFSLTYLAIISVFLRHVLSIDSAIDDDLGTKKITKNEPVIEYLTHQNCSNITLEEMNVVASFYPYVKLRCKAEESVLIPTDLDVPENIETLKIPRGLSDLFRPKVYTFNEFRLELESDPSRFLFPIFPCTKALANGKGNFEATFTARAMVSALGLLTRPLPYFTTKGTVKLMVSPEFEFSYSVMCFFEEHNVRPIVEMTTILTHEKVREWTFDKTKTPFIKYGEWFNLDREQVLEDTFVVSCVSEKYIPAICQWSDAEVVANLAAKKLQSGKVKKLRSKGWGLT